MRRAVIGCLLVLGLLGGVGCSGDDDTAGTTTSSAAGSGAGSTTGSGTAAADCAWKVRADQETLNVAYPDTAATYWTMSYALAPGEHLELAGTFPDARYASFVSYGPGGGAIDSLTDRDIDPDDGSVNPFRPTADPAAGTERRYTVTVRPTGPSDDANVLGAAPAAGDAASTTTTTAPPEDDRVILGSGGDDAVEGTAIYRVYLPADADDRTGGAGLPEVSLVDGDGRATRIPTCAHPGASKAALAIVESLERPATTTPPTPIFIRPKPSNLNLFPNPDNVYVATILAHHPGQVAVIRGRAPTFPDTRHGTTVGGDEQVRFWSMCTNELRKPYPVTDCAADEETKLDADGWFTYVISTPEDRPAATAATAGATWLDWGSTEVDDLVLMRHMLAADSFTQSANRVEPGALATSTMGDYAPRGAYCDTATFEQGGYAACGL